MDARTVLTASLLWLSVAASVPAARAQTTVETPAYVLPTERYGVAWGDPPEAVVDRFGRAPDATEPAGSLTYLGPTGGQTVFVFASGADGVERLAAVVDATPLFADAEAADAEHARYKAALAALFGEPALDESPRPDQLGVSDTAWAPGGDVRAVELMRDAVDDGSGVRPFFYVRVVGPAVE